MNVRCLNWVLLFLMVLAGPNVGMAGPLKPRILVLTDISPPDIEPDDQESLIRLLVHGDLFEIEGLIATTGWSSSGGNAGWTNLIHRTLDAYARDLPNLRRRSNQQGHRTDESRQEIGYWPSPESLHACTRVGSQVRGVKFLGAENDSPGSDWIIRVVDEPDERPVWIQAWGGANTLAQAIWRVRKQRTPEQLRAFLHKIRLYAITDQDRGYEKGTPFDLSAHQWLRREFAGDLCFLWDESAWTYQNGTGKARWDEYAAAIQGHGHLGAMYPKYRYGVEGDTPAFLYVLPNGLNVPEHPEFGGWGGYFRWGTGPDALTLAYVNQPGTPAHAVSRKYEARFYPAIFNDFAARMQWAKDGVGNRNPEVVVNGDSGMAPLVLTPAPGTDVILDAGASRDPDGNPVQINWWVLPEAGTDSREIPILNGGSSRATVRIPDDAAGHVFHVICEVSDQGTPPLSSYRRILIQPAAVASAETPVRNAAASVRPRVMILSDFPPLDVIPGGAGRGAADQRSDPDDLQSMVRFLLYSNEFDVEGLVATAGTFANLARKQPVLDLLERYDQVDENLRKRDPRYPTADRLRSVTWQGRDGTWGQPAEKILGVGQDSEASEAILRAVDASDPRPLWICVWGGPSDLAQAIWKVQRTRSPEAVKAFIRKLRVFMIGLGDQPGQDGSGQWLLDQFPDLFVIVSQRTYAGMFAQRSPLGDLGWLDTHIRTGHGPLGAAYPRSGFDPGSPGQQEGDSPSFLYLYGPGRGMSDPDQPDHSSWGGQYVRRDSAKNHWYDGPGAKSVAQWMPAIQADFARRANWMLP